MRRSVLLALLALALVIAGCGGGGSNIKKSDDTKTTDDGSGQAVTGGAGGAAHRGGTMNLVASGVGTSIDPQNDYDGNWDFLRMSYDGLLAYKQVGGKDGNTLVPDLATEIPKPEDGGKTYTATLRKGVLFSSGEEVKPSDFTYTFEREFKIPGPGTSFFAGLVGGDVCLKHPKKCDLSKGVVADDAAGTVTFHLTAPDPDFLQKLAIPFSYVVPKGTGNDDVGNKAAPGTGPYVIETYKPDREVVWVRNPHFKQWSKDAQPDGYVDRIEMKVGLTLEDQTTQVANGQADWMYDQPPADRLNEVATKYPDRVHINPTTQMYYMALNTKVAPFNDLKVRQALNYATDRNAVIGIFGGPRLAQPSCQTLPPNFPGYQPYCPYTKDAGSGRWTGPDLAKAKQLISESGTQGTKVSVISTPDSATKDQSLYFVSLLKQLGYKASLKTLSSSVQYSYVQDSRNKPQISLTYWVPDYVSAGNFLTISVGCDGYHPGTTANPNLSMFCDKAIQAKVEQAQAQQQTNPDAANGIWAQVDKMTVDQAPEVPLYNASKLDFVSERIGNYQFNPSVTGRFMITQAWVK
jgi:peptide/nickel transport system substrate-binding protein